MSITAYPDRDTLAAKAAQALAADLNKALRAHGRARFAVAGGTTPGPIFDLLSDTDLDWARITVMPSDERWVPPSHAQSNAALITSRLLTGKAAAARFVPFFRAGLDPVAGAAAVAGDLGAHLPLDVLMLGMGGDMHTASLFPGVPDLEPALAADAPALCPMRLPGQDIVRVSLPGHVISAAKATHVVIFGDDKRAAYDRAQTLPVTEAPIQVVSAGATIHWAA